MNRFSYALAPINPAAQPENAHQFLEGSNIFSGLDSFRDQFGGISSLEVDLLQLASVIFAADRASQRGEREEYRRFIEVRVPVTNYDLLSKHVGILRTIMRRLSQDVWTLDFMPRQSEHATQEESELRFEPKGGATLLFSGGLDSLAGAVEFGKSTEPLLLTSHITRNHVTDGAQQELASMLTKNGFNVEHKHFFVSSRDGGPTNLQHQLEPSQRTRSFVFLTLGVLAARRTNRSTLVSMAENGQMAIHLPLSAARIGAFSTHTAHPSVLSECERFFRSVLSYDITIQNPYLYKTKAEVVAPVCAALPSSIPISTSCWRNARPLANGARHCGECVPCLIRRIALDIHGVDPTLYAVDLFNTDVASLPPDHDGRRNFVELCEFATRFEAAGDYLSEFPELVSSDFDDSAAIEMYKRFASECRQVVSAHTNLSWMLP